MPRNKTNGQLIKTAERRTFVLNLRKSGASYEQIAQATAQHFGLDTLPNGWDVRYAWKDVTRELTVINEERAEGREEVRALHVARCEEMILGLWPQARKGHHGSVDRVLRVMTREAALLGLDAPVKLAPTDPTGEQEYGSAQLTNDERRAALAAIFGDGQIPEAGDGCAAGGEP